MKNWSLNNTIINSKTPFHHILKHCMFLSLELLYIYKFPLFHASGQMGTRTTYSGTSSLPTPCIKVRLKYDNSAMCQIKPRQYHLLSVCFLWNTQVLSSVCSVIIRVAVCTDYEPLEKDTTWIWPWVRNSHLSILKLLLDYTECESI